MKAVCVRATTRGVGMGRGVRCAGVAMAAAAVGVCAPSAFADLPPYELVGSFTAPAGVWDVLPDGRLVTLTGASNPTVSVQDAINGSGYSALGEISTAAPIASFGASFLRVSPSGGTIAVGDNNFSPTASVYTFAFADLNTGSPAATQRFVTPNFDAAFGDDDTLFVTGADSGTFASGVYRLDLSSPATPAALVIDDLGGASAGIVVNDGVLYTGNGFDTAPGGSATGEVRAVELSALASGPVSFEAGMTPVAATLSAASLGFDPLGNLFVGGGDSFGMPQDLGYAAVIDGDAIAAALGGGGFTPGADLELSPASDPNALYTVRFNAATDELLVATGGVVYRYAIPAPGVVGVAFAALPMIARRRRRGA